MRQLKGIYQIAAGILLQLCLLQPVWGQNYQPCENFPNYCISTGNQKFTYYKIGQNLVDFVSMNAKMIMQNPKNPSLFVISSNGSIENVIRMRHQPGVNMSIVQSDVLLHYKVEAEKGNRDAIGMINQLRVLLPLYQEEVHIIVRADSQINWLHQLYGKKISLGPKTSGSSLTGHLFYKLMTNNDLQESNVLYTVGDNSFDDSLNALLNQDVDALFMVTGQPSGRLAEFPEKVKNLIKMVKVDYNNEVTTKIFNGPYYKSVIPKESYPWLTEDIPTISVRAYLVSKEYNRLQSKENIVKFVKSICRNFPTLKKNGHPKWKEMVLDLEKLPGGWRYSSDAEVALKSKDCQQECTPEQEMFKLCKKAGKK
ncbi:MAG: TAXI family TRAP transporter solute-binding subunit [Magnetococcus sp. DMHC-1]|nr:TAXI family TRAP transporter solute-binding subunit [Magnetococcales bacterium]